jgi:hypothetical protein
MYLPLQDPPKFTKIRILGLKICHLAILHGTVKESLKRGRGRPSQGDQMGL